MRLDQALAQLMPEHSRSRIKSWIEAGRVTLSGEPADAKRKLRGGELVADTEGASPNGATGSPEREPADDATAADEADEAEPRPRRRRAGAGRKG